jgi:hypothetical protein
MADRTFHHDYREWAVSKIYVFLHSDMSGGGGSCLSILNGLAQ